MDWKKNKTLITNNEIILKKLGRINNFFDKDRPKPSATLVISGDIFKVYFDENVDLNLIKENLAKRKNIYQEEINYREVALASAGDRLLDDLVRQTSTHNSSSFSISEIMVSFFARLSNVSSDSTTPQPNVSSVRFRSKTITSLSGSRSFIEIPKYRPAGPPPKHATRIF